MPNDPETVLARRYGDCKDAATLLMALLAAKAIEGEAALVNTAPAYGLNEVPTVGTFNHVIVYLPQLDLYADPTVPSSGMLIGRSGTCGAVPVRSTMSSLPRTVIVTASGRSRRDGSASSR